MNMITKREIDSYGTIFHFWPKYLQFYGFLKRGFYNGPNWNIRFRRIWCWFDKHDYTGYYQINIEGDGKCRIKCCDCGYENTFKLKNKFELKYILENIQKDASTNTIK